MKIVFTVGLTVNAVKEGYNGEARFRESRVRGTLDEILEKK